MGRNEPDIATPSGASAGFGRRVLRQGSRALYWVHRWLGVATCLLCVMWFLSGLVMLYVPFPSWSDEERIASLPPIAVERVRVTPDEALARAGVTSRPSSFRLETMQGQPIYRIAADDRRLTVSAETGELLARIDGESAARHLASLFPGARPTLIEEIDYDQWTVTRRFDVYRPLYKFTLGDAADTIVHVSSQTGEIVQHATRSERVWNWLGAIPHWIYFSPIRRDQELWRQAVMWLSGPAVIGAFTGIWIGILRLRVKRRYARGRVTPYRGWMKWHHVGGLVGGVFVTTWLVSGWLSVSPFKMFQRTQLTETQLAAYAGWTPGAKYGVALGSLQRIASLKPSEITFVHVGGVPLTVARGRGGLFLTGADGAEARLADAALFAAAERAFPSARLIATERMEEESLYWYSHHASRPLPILKAVFDDPGATWLFLDPATGAIAGLGDTKSRTYRWLFNFFHDYDLPVLLRNQPARDLVVWLLSIAGLVISVSGVVVGYRVLVRR